ncbi:MAG: glycosyltransferase [Oxalobacter formigenes]|nr:glycosyltransferase [Oxalobacter formigenes]
MPLVSVIVPVYNVGPYLRRCMDSLCAQTLQDIEIICINDGSTDISPQILEEYASSDKRIRVIHQENRGLSAARNAGLAVVQSPYIAFVDSDDWIAPQTYQVATEIFLKDSELDFVSYGTSVWMIDDGEWKVKENWHPIFKEELAIEGKASLSQEIKADIRVRVWNKLYKTAIIQDKNITFTEKQLFEDNAFWIKYAAWANTGYFIQEPYYCYRIARPNSIMTEKKNNLSMLSSCLYFRICMTITFPMALLKKIACYYLKCCAR